MDQDVGLATGGKVQAVLIDVIRRRANGELLSDQAILAEHPDLIGPLQVELKRLSPVDDAATNIECATPDFASQPDFSPDTVDFSRVSTGGDGRSSKPTLFSSPSSSESDRFCKLRSHATGGMGQVWVAIDTQIHREVALKELKPQRNHDKDVCDRFLSEGHITGALEHPGIVPVYALGMDKQNLPYYAMRFVRGESLRHRIKTFHSDVNGSSFSRSNSEFRELLRRFADVCVTVAYAHSRGVLHRDLKPDNVMLGKYGETYVVDWGLARIVGARAEGFSLVTEHILTPAKIDGDSGTRYGSAMGTPGYMSPEQAAGRLDQLTPATDIYSLGAILYYLLTNESPIVADTMREFFRMVETGDFQPPQVINAAAPKSLSAACLKAMATSPVDRYSSARDLASDVEKWLADEPLMAAPDTRFEKVSRFARRHYRWLVPLVAALAMISLAAVFAATSIDRARRKAELAATAEAKAKNQAEANFLEARDAVDQWLTGFTEALAYYPGVDAFRQRMLEQAAHRYEGFIKQAGDDPALRLEAGRTWLRLGNIHRQLLAPEKATSDYQKAGETFSRLMKSGPDSAAEDGLAQTYGQLALAYAESGERDRSEEFHKKALSVASASVSKTKTDPPETRQDLEITLGNIEINYAGFLAQQGRMKDALKIFSDVTKRFERLAREDSGDIETRTSLATAMLGLGQVTSKLGDTEKARTTFRQAAAYFNAAAQLTDETPRYITLSADANLLLAISEGQLGNYAAEADSYRQIIAAYDRLNAQLPNVPSLINDQARTQIDYGQSLIKLGKIEDGRNVLQTAEQTFEKLKLSHPSVAPFAEAHAVALDHLGTAHAILGDFDSAETLAQSSVSELGELAKAWPDVPEYRLRTATAESHLAQLRFMNGQIKPAEESFIQAVDRTKTLVTENPADPGIRYAAAMVESRFAEMMAIQGNLTSAGEHASMAHSHWQRLLELSSDAEFQAAAARYYLTCRVVAERNPTKASTYAETAVKQSPNNTSYEVLYALARLQNGMAAKSLELLKALPADNSSIASKFVASMAYAELEESDKAMAAYRGAVELAEKNQPGEWELRTLRLMSENALEIKAKPSTE